MTTLVIASKQIRQLDGLFNLNDLHKAAGGEHKHQPNRFLRLQQTKDLINEISNYPDMGNSNPKWTDMSISNSNCPDVDNSNIKAVETRKGANGGTFVCEELIIAYAMWISAKIHLQAIRALRQLHSREQNKTPPYDLNNLPETNHNGQRIMPPIHNEPADVPTQYFIIKQEHGKPAETHPLDLKMLRELVSTQNEFGLVPHSMVNALVTSLGDAMHKSTVMIQFAQAKIEGG